MLQSQSTKRLLDLIVSLLALIILSPVLIGIALAVFYSMGFPILFKQQRVGENGRLFAMLKFRSMVCNAARYTYQSNLSPV